MNLHSLSRVLLCCLAAAPGWAARIAPEGLRHLPAADVVILGEVHDNIFHHANQVRAVDAIAPRALVFEMLGPEQAARVTPALRDDPAALEAALGWEASGWPDFTMYYPIFAAAPQATIFGGALPRDEVRRAMTEGPAPVFGPKAASYGLLDPLPPDEQAAREADQLSAHCNALPEAALPGMVAAQRLRDAALARAVVAALAATGGPVVLITGTGHARFDRGVPAALAQAAPELRVISVGQYESDPGPSAPHDYWLVTDPVPRPDPCATFR
jgi:uncharacterized iron-regulated protein